MLSGCSTKEFKFGWYDKSEPKYIETTKKVYPEISEEFLNCDAIPKPPLISKQSDVAFYIVNLTVAGRGCKEDLLYVKMVLDKFKEPKDGK